MPGKKKKICEKCGDETDTLYQGYCNDCYGKMWDAGFESTSQHAEEVAEYDEEQLEKVNKLGNKSKVDYVKLAKTAQYRMGKWRCAKCGKVRIRSDKHQKLRIEDYGNPAELIEELKKPCKHCKVKGYYKFDPRA